MTETPNTENTTDFAEPEVPVAETSTRHLRHGKERFQGRTPIEIEPAHVVLDGLPGT